MEFSVAICTYNRSGHLQRALESLSRCEDPGCEWELLIIDNNSSDSTANVVELASRALPIRYIFERTQGLSAARNRALSEFSADALVFTDDDLVFDTNWLVSYRSAFKTNSDAAWFGGRVVPWWESGKPRWLKDENLELLKGLMVFYDLGSSSRTYEEGDPSPFGASFALRRSAIDAVGAFRLDLGVRGDTPGRGEEAEYFARIRALGLNGYYVGDSCAHHWQDPRRFKFGYLYRYGLEKGRAEVVLNASSSAPIGLGHSLPAFFIKAIYQMIKRRGDRARQCVINMGIASARREIRG